MGKEYLDILPGNLFYRTVWVTAKLARGGTDHMATTICFRIPRHHCLVLGLRNFVFPQVKPASQGNIMFRFVYPYLPHRKSAWFHPDHFEVHGGVELHHMRYFLEG